MEHFVTLFDSAFLPQGLALHSSLTRHAGEFMLWVLCLDDGAKAALDVLNRPSIRTIALADVETSDLLGVKSSRSRAEYCWTLTPFAPKIVFDCDPSIERVTYLDADLFLLKPLHPIFEEFEQSKKAVLITDHAYDPEYDHSLRTGQYCVQFLTFVREVSEPVRKWWEQRCIEWCFSRFEDNKFGDQKYLDDWPYRFGDLVHVLQRLDSILAPWNARRFPYSSALVWHFHGLRLLENRKVLLYRDYRVPKVVDEAIYVPYVEELTASMDLLGKSVVQAKLENFAVSWVRSLAISFLRLLRSIRNRNVVYKMNCSVRH